MTTFVVDKTYSCQIQITPKAESVMRMFGLDADRLAESSPRQQCTFELSPGQIAFITGPSGSGKSVLLRELMAACNVSWASRPCSLSKKGLKGRRLIAQGGAKRSPGYEDNSRNSQALKGRDNADCNDAQLAHIIDLDSIKLSSRRAVIDCIDGNFLDALRTLSIAGLSDVFAILNQPAHLSEGQKYRFRLAKALSLISSSHESRVPSHGIIFADEFCSNLDRITAAVIAYQIRKFATRHNVSFILASAHTDILADLRPDVIISKHLNAKTEVIYKNRNAKEYKCPCKPPSLSLELGPEGGQRKLSRGRKPPERSSICLSPNGAKESFYTRKKT